MEKYINNETLIENKIVNLLKSSIICPLCNNIFIKPLMCINCQKVYCKKCIDNWSKDKEKCPNNCQNPNYKDCMIKNDILSKLQFNCLGCDQKILYFEVENHYNTCHPNKESLNIKNIKKNKPANIKKLSSDEVAKLTEKGEEITYISGKKLFIIIIYI